MIAFALVADVLPILKSYRIDQHSNYDHFTHCNITFAFMQCYK